jgi:hypothetical protein
MDYEQIAGFQPALAQLLENFRHCFKRKKTFGIDKDTYWV